MVSNFFKCPKCGGTDFKEYAYNETLQHGVKIVDLSDGGFDPDYDRADAVEFLDNFKILGYGCETCEADFIVEDGKIKLNEGR